MVEKIIVNPEEIRGLGNIVSSNHSLEDYKVYMSTLEEGTAEIEGVETVVYEMDPLGSDISIALTLSASTISIGGTVTVTATVTEDESPVSGVSVSFKQGDTVLGSSTTNSSGVATYTYTGAEVGTYTIRATYNNVYSNAETLLVDKVNTTTTFTANPTVITVLNDTLLTATVLDENSNPVVNEYVEFYVYYGGRSIALAPSQTDSNGVATYSYHTNRTGEMEVYAIFLNCTNYNRSESNHVPISVESHTYSLEFSESSYTATGGSCTVSVLLEKDSAPLADAVVTFSSDESTTVTATTGSDGVASATISFNDSTTLMASYNNITDTAEITVPAHLYAPKLDGTEPLYQISGTTTVSNGEMSGGTCYLTQGWDNTIDWELNFEAYFDSRDGESIQLSFGNPTRADYNCIRFLCPAYNSIQTNKPSTTYNEGFLNSVTQSTWLSFNVKRVGNTMTVKIGNNNATTHNYRFSEYDTVCIGTNSWGNVAKLRNITVDAL